VARDRTAQPGDESDATVERIRTLSDRVLEGVREGGEAALQAYERTLRALADYQEAAGQRGPEWVRGLAKAQASLTRELASASPAAARALRDRMDELTGAAARHAERAPSEEQAEGQAREPAAAREQAPPISRYDELAATEIVSRLPKLSKSDVGKVAEYERAHKSRKTILKKIDTLR
jgi:hypothetical protein